ncbi:tetratricopeptide repeat protein [Desulfobotulus sp. H1]|uniref:Tetratricopeptide repeat protein n=1 Tax=Desulfobotulus pelophilus TaxID=2823377 RepID=A0ABT3NBE3_9BACT|nr:tetratricopeptide repeat protein [Desulfobotulus pelophilus]MCW7754740.1 tetratricopeptide repeat protein [Desulfobotulus pelophilus]
MEEKTNKNKMPEIPFDMIEDDPIARFFTRVWDACNTYTRELVIGGFVLIVVLAGGFGYWGWQVAAERDAATRLGLVLQAAEVTENGSSSVLLEELRALQNDRPGTLSGRMARIYEARMLFDSGDAEAALGAYDVAFSLLGKDKLLGRLIVWERAHVRLALGDKETALSDFTRIASEKDFFLQESAMFHVARLEAEMGAPEKSRAAYERMLDRYPDSPYREVRVF